MGKDILPVFPLKGIFFPGHSLALRIFEERYLRLLEDTGTDGRFIVALISSGREVGGEATPFRVGCLVAYDEPEEAGDVLVIRPLARQRVYLHAFDRQSRPYLLGAWEEYRDLPGSNSDSDPGHDGAGRLAELEDALVRMARAPADEAGSPQARERELRRLLDRAREELDPENYSLFLCGCLDLPPIYRQHLLESRSAAYRAEALLKLLQAPAT